MPGLSDALYRTIFQGLYDNRSENYWIATAAGAKATWPGDPRGKGCVRHRWQDVVKTKHTTTLAATGWRGGRTAVFHAPWVGQRTPDASTNKFARKIHVLRKSRRPIHIYRRAMQYSSCSDACIARRMGPPFPSNPAGCSFSPTAQLQAFSLEAQASHLWCASVQRRSTVSALSCSTVIRSALLQY